MLCLGHRKMSTTELDSVPMVPASLVITIHSEVHVRAGSVSEEPFFNCSRALNDQQSFR